MKSKKKKNITNKQEKWHTICSIIHMRNKPNLVSSIGAFRAAHKLRPSTCRVSSGSIMPSSQSLKMKVYFNQNGILYEKLFESKLEKLIRDIMFLKNCLYCFHTWHWNNMGSPLSQTFE